MLETFDEHIDGEENISRKRSYNNDEENDEKQTKSSEAKRLHGKQPLLKLLVPNYAAGAIIGKGGMNLGDLQSRYGATIRISHNKEFYPGTDERIVILSGEVNQIIEFHEYIIDNVQEDAYEGVVKRPKGDIRGQQVKIVLPNTTVGVIIGCGGATIKALVEATKAKIVITGREQSMVVGERILIITGNTEQRIEAAKQVINKIAVDPDNMSNTNLKYSHSFHIGRHNEQGVVIGPDILNIPLNEVNQNLFSAMSRNPLSTLSQNPLTTMGLGAFPSTGSTSHLGSLAELTPGSNVESDIKTTAQIEMEIPDSLVGPIMYKILEFMKFSGAKMQFSQKSDGTPGAKILTIHGDLNQTQIAYFFVHQKINQLRNELSTLTF